MNIIKAEAYLDMLKDKAKETDMLAKENLELRRKINKAIEYIKNNACYDEETMQCCDDLDVNDCDKVLDILRGEKK